ncbi:hypothetical protein [Vibrio alginolyticus]|uniref:hypothetical protein n=1 Tax=Vibrio alginolyticus TaxID=663 RepID=UPI001C05FDD4|nr:hypothetical protein [Vibrio alginolyticus]
MKLKYRSRLEQKTQAFSLEKTTRKDIDCILDGVDIPRPMYSKNWVQESNVHQAVKLTDSVLTTRNFVGAQANIVRDELRKLTYALHIEGDENYLILSKIKDSKIVKQSTIDKNVWRSHLALDKYTGKCSALYIKTVEQDNRLYLDGKEIQTQDSDIDFPYLSFSQLPIGHVPNKPANFILLSYKSRATGNIYYREVSSVGIGSEKLLTQKPCIGGGPFAAIGNKVIFHINLVHNTTYQPAIIESNDGGESLSDTVPIDLSDLDDEIEFNPEMAAPFVDYSGIIHIPISAQVGKTIKLIDVIPQDSTATEMIEMSMYSGVGRVAAVPFPKKYAPLVYCLILMKFHLFKTGGLAMVKLMVLEL